MMLCSTSTPLQTTPLWMSYMSTPLQKPLHTRSRSATDLCGGSCSSPLNISCTQNCQYPLPVPYWGDGSKDHWRTGAHIFSCAHRTMVRVCADASPSFSTKSMGHNAGVDFALDGNLIDWTTSAHSRMGQSVNTTKTEVVCQWTSSTLHTLTCLHHQPSTTDNNPLLQKS